MKIIPEFHRDREVVMLRASGKMTIGGGDVEIREAVKDVGDWNVVLDLSNVSVIDSSGMGEMFGILQICEKRNKRLVLLKPSLQIKSLLGVVCPDLFKVFEDEKEALANF